MICIAWFGLWFGISNTFGVVEWGRKKNRETDEEHNEDCVEEGFKLTMRKFDRDGEGCRKALGKGIVVSIFEMYQN